MDIGIGLPVTIVGHAREQLLDWAAPGEAREFSTLATIDRIVYGNYEPLIALAAAAAVTERIRLIDHHPHRPVPAQRRARRQAGGLAGPPLRRPAGARGRRRRPRGRLRGLRRRLPLARRGHGRDARAVGADLGRRVVRLRRRDRPAAAARAPDLADRRRRGCRLPAPRAVRRRLDSWAAARRTCSARERRRPERRGGPPAATASRARLALAYFALGDGAEEARERLPSRLLRVPRRVRRHDRRAAPRPTRTRRAQYAQGFAEAGCDELLFMPCSPDPGQVRPAGRRRALRAELVLDRERRSAGLGRGRRLGGRSRPGPRPRSPRPARRTRTSR